jgi:disulfide bond formation protein DsbB
MKKIFSHAALISSLITAASVLALALAFTAQFIFHLEPCPLCLMQRLPYAATALLGLVGLGLAKTERPKGSAFAIFLASLAFLTGAGIAFYHNGVEQHWWESFLEGCKVTFSADNAKTLLEKIEAAAPAKCDQIPWSDPVLHLSMAAWNTIASLTLAATSLLSAILVARKANGF